MKEMFPVWGLTGLKQTEVLRRVVTQSAAFVLKHHVCAINVEQLVGIHRYQDAAYVGLFGRRERERSE